MIEPDHVCALCGGTRHTQVATFNTPPASETDFGITPYYRELWQCESCGHVVNRCDADLSTIYSGQYRETVYGDQMRQKFDSIMSLPQQKSDNRQRVARIMAFLEANHDGLSRRLLDIGSGLAVFPAAMSEIGWHCTVIDPDAVAVEHARRVANAEGRCGDFFALPVEGSFDLVSLNKVIEHVRPMTEMLSRAGSYVARGGHLYVEVPDGEAALQDPDEGPAREEFTIDHLCAFSLGSLALLGRHAGLEAALIGRLREPSGKYSLYAFFSPGVGANPPTMSTDGGR